MSIFGDYVCEDSQLVKEVSNIHGQIDLATLTLESISKNLDAAELSLLLPYLDAINVLSHRALKFLSEIKSSN